MKAKAGGSCELYSYEGSLPYPLTVTLHLQLHRVVFGVFLWRVGSSSYSDGSDPYSWNPSITAVRSSCVKGYYRARGLVTAYAPGWIFDWYTPVSAHGAVTEC